MNRKNRKVKSKPVFCHDENLEFYLLKKHCNQFARFESVAKIFKTSAKDPLLIQECNKKNIHIITHNTRHFLKPKEKIKIGIVCVNTQEEESFIPRWRKPRVLTRG